MVKRYNDLLDRQCELVYYMGVSLSDIDECDVGDLAYMSAWLVRKQKEKTELYTGMGANKKSGKR